MRASVAFRVGLVAAITVAVWLGQASRGEPPKRPEEKPPPPVRYPWDSDRDWALRQKLVQRVPEINFDASLFEDVLQRLEDISGITMRANWTAMEAQAIEKDAEVTLKSRDARLCDVLDAALEQVSAGEVQLLWEVIDEAVVISTREDLERSTITVVFECADFVQVEEKKLADYVHTIFDEIVKRSGRDLSRDTDETEHLVRRVIQDSRQQLQKELMEAIRASVDPESWREAGGNVGTMKWVGTQLIVSQTRLAHRQVLDLLTKLRDQRDRQPAKARWP